MTEPQTILRMRLPQSLKDWLDAEAAAEAQTTSAYVRSLLVERRKLRMVEKTANERAYLVRS